MSTTGLERNTYKKGDVIFREGDTQTRAMFDIIDGCVGIYANYGTAEEKLLTTLKAEQYFGEMGLIEARPRSATAVVLEKSIIITITSDNFADYLKEKPTKIILIMQNMSNRIRQLSDDYLDACRTIDEYLEAEKNNAPKSEGLIEKMKKIVAVGRSNKKK